MPIAPPPPLFPPGGTLAAASIAMRCDAELLRARRRVDAIVVRPGPRTFATVTAALEDAQSDLADALAVPQFLALVAPDADVRRASARCGAAVTAFEDELPARPDVYAALRAARASGTAATPAQRALGDLALATAQRSGAALAPAARAEVAARERTLADLANGFASVLAGDTTSIEADGQSVPVNEGTAGAFMAGETDAAARKAYYLAYYRRGGTLNAGFVRQALAERARLAHLLGYPSWAAYVTAGRAAGSPAHVLAFLNRIDAALLPRARADWAKLAARKGAPLEPWDVTFYQSRLRAERYGVDGAQIAAYFPAPHVIDAVLALSAQLFGLTFTAAPDLPRWDPAVRAYRVADARTGASRGIVYLDLYARPGKLDRLANAPLLARRVLPGGSVRPAVNAILGGWPPPLDGRPTLLAHADVIAFLHEFGHNLAALLADTPYETLNAGWPPDFAEAPAEMMEQLAWSPAALARLSANVEGGAPLPADLIARMLAARRFDAAYATVVQTFYAAVDQQLHLAAPPVDVLAIWQRTLAAMTPLPFAAGTLPQASFAHLMNGYEAGYYGYLWAQVDADDLYAALAPAGVPDPQAGRRLRDEVLAPARSLDPQTAMLHFLGRPADARAFYRALGLER
jgi:thimet oligopeptidase